MLCHKKVNKATLFFLFQELLQRPDVKPRLDRALKEIQAKIETLGPSPGQLDLEEDPLLSALVGDPVQVFRYTTRRFPTLCSIFQRKIVLKL